MIQQHGSQWSGVVDAWNRLVAVAVPNEEEARLGRLFNILMILSVFAVTALSLAFVVAGWLNLFGTPAEAWIGLGFPAIFIPVSAFCFIQSRQGRIRPMIQFYVWLNFGAILLACIVFGGHTATGWLLFFWPVMLAGTLMEPVYALRMSVAVILLYGLTLLAVQTHLYTPPLTLRLEAFRFLGMAFSLIMLLAAGGVVNYLNLSSLRDVFSRLRSTTRSLEEARVDLEKRVEERTAEAQMRAEQFRAIAELSRTASSVQDLQRLLDTTVSLISQRLGYYHAGIFLVDPSGEWAVLRAASSEGGRRMLARGHRLKVGRQGIVGYVAETGAPRLAFNVGEDAVWVTNPDLPKTQSEMALPFAFRGRITGVLDIQTEVPAAFSQEDVDVLRVLADSVAVAIENARSLAEARETLERLQRYQEEDALSAWRQALTRRSMRVGYQYDSGLVSRTENSEAPFLMLQRNLREVTTLTTEEGLHFLLAPIRFRDQNLGVLAFQRPIPWTTEQIRLAQVVIEQLDLALDNARLLEETRLRASQERARSEILSRVRVMGTPDAILRSAAEELGRALQVERSRIQLLPPGEGALDRQK